jgi:hypothetical protein
MGLFNIFFPKIERRKYLTKKKKKKKKKKKRKVKKNSVNGDFGSPASVSQILHEQSFTFSKTK